MMDITHCVVWPCFSNVQVFNEHARVSSPELFCWNKSAWRDNWSWSNLSTIFYFSSFKNDTFVSNNNIITNMAWIKGTIRSYDRVFSDVKLGWHAGWKRRSGMKNCILSNRGKWVNFNSIYITPNDCVVPYGSKSSQLNLTDHSSIWGNPVLFCPWCKIIEW